MFNRFLVLNLVESLVNMEINYNKVVKIKKIGKVDISELEEKVKLLSAKDWDTKEDFKVNYNKNESSNKGALGSTQHIIFKFINKKTTPFEYIHCSRWNIWEPILMPILINATKYLNYEHPYFPKIMLASLPAKKFIPPHIDGKSDGYVAHKIHIPIETNSESFFFLEADKFHFEKGIAYEVNNGKVHGVVNNGDTNRIHLIFECLDFDTQTPEIKHQMKSPKISSI